MNSNSYIKFLDPYDKGDENIFFGRDKEIEQLYSKVKKTNLFVLYGLSGTGKTSILHCGLANKFDESDWFEIFIRRGSDRSIMDAVLDEIKKISDSLDDNDSSPDSLIDKLNDISIANYRHLYLIFDQFEELFINGVSTEKDLFIQFLQKIISKPEKFATIILVLREEYLANLNDFKLTIKSIFNDSIRLERMSKEILGDQVIKNILTKADLDFSEKIIPKIIENVTDPNNQQIDLPYVQAYLKELFDKIEVAKAEKNKPERFLITEDILPSPASIDDLLGSFLDTSINDIITKSSGLFSNNDIWKMLKILITPDGTKRSLSFESINEEFK